MSSTSLLSAASIAAVLSCLAGCQVVEQPVGGKSDSGSCKQAASLAYLRDSSVVLNSKTVTISEITSNSVYSSSYDPKYAFDGMPAGNWTQWISGYDFGTFKQGSKIQVRYTVPRVVIGYTLLGRYESLMDRLPKDWILQGTNDATGSVSDPPGSARWTTLDSATAMTLGKQWNSPLSYAGITRAISCPSAYSAYRLCVTAVNGSDVVDLIEIELLARPDGQLLSPRDSAKNPPLFPVIPPKDTLYTTNSVYGSEYGPENAFDHMPPGDWTQWISDHLFRPFVEAAVIQVEYPSARRIASYALVGRYDILKDRLPKDWVLQGSNDAQASVDDGISSSRWSTVDSVSGAEIGGAWNSTTSSARLSRTATNPGTYKKYRLCVTAVNGSSVADLIEIELKP